MPRRPATEPTARDRLLAAADALFYEEGVHTVGIDRIIERAGVAKASLYSTFGSKDALIAAYLAGRDVAREERITAALARFDTPRERLLGLFDVLGELFSEPGYHGCAFVNASAEASADDQIQAATTRYRGWVRSLLVDLAREAGAAEPERLARQLQLLYDGAGLSARLEGDPDAALFARAAAVTLLDASLGAADAATD